jgi:hypothetical protein
VGRRDLCGGTHKPGNVFEVRGKSHIYGPNREQTAY